MRFTRLQLISLPIVVLVLLLILATCSVYPARASSVYSIPIRALLLTDEGNPYTSSLSDLFGRTTGVLNVNKIPFDVLDVSQIDQHTFLDNSLYPKYSVLLVISPGYRIDSTSSKLILRATEKGMGLVGLHAGSANADLMSTFGIRRLGTKWSISNGIQIIKDKFTFSYQGQTISVSDEDFPYLDHHLHAETEVIASFSTSGDPALWINEYGKGKVVFHNNNSASSILYSGILLQSILYAMPIGVASPINAGAISVDDYPRSFLTDKERQDWHYNFYYNFKEWLQTYNFTATFYIIFSYSGNKDDFWRYPESIEGANDLINSGYELGLHGGNKHIPLKVAYWGSEVAIDAEVDEMMQALEILRAKLQDRYGTKLGEIISYTPLNLIIDDYGYEALDTITDIRYVTSSYSSKDEVIARDFGWERDLDIYNLSRIKGSFYEFNQPQDDKYSRSWNILRSRIEGGDTYLIFTHPDEVDLLHMNGDTDASMAGMFEGLTVWGDYVRSRYPFYRWWTMAEIGRYLEKREGTLNAEWYPADGILKLRLSQTDDAIHIKTEQFLANISQTNEAIIVTFSRSVSDFESDDYDIVNINQDYFIYPRDSKSSRPIVSENPFKFRHIPMPVTELQDTVHENVLPMLATEPQNTASKNALLPLQALPGIIVAGAILLAGTLIIRRIHRE